MTKKDYELIAQGLKIAGPSATIPANMAPEDVQAYRQGRKHSWQNSCKTLADLLALDNPLFSRNRFLTACGIDER